MQAYDSIVNAFHYEETIQKSRFIVDIFPITTEDEAKKRLIDIRKTHYDATHHCSAYRLGISLPTEHSSDDGEPAGTAGRPMLSVLRHQELTNLIAIITRYFGGIKLGTGGLVRAYGGTLANAIMQAPVVRFTPHQRLHITLPYELFGSIENEWKDHPYIIVDRIFSDRVTLVADIPLPLVTNCTTHITDLTAARADIILGETHLIPLPR